MHGQQRNRSSSPQKKVKGPMGTIGEKGLSKKEQTQALQSLKAMFDGRIEPDVIEMVLMEKSWKVDEAVQILSSMVEDEKPQRSDSFSQFDLIAFSLLDSAPDIPEQRQILEGIQLTSNSSKEAPYDNNEVQPEEVRRTKEEMATTPKPAPLKTHSSKKSKNTSVKSEKGRKKTKKCINIPNNNDNKMAAKQIKTPPSFTTNQPQNIEGLNLIHQDALTCSESISNTGSLKGDNTDIAGLSNFTLGHHHNMSADFSVPLESYLDMYGGNFGLTQPNEGFWDLSEGFTSSLSKENVQSINLPCPGSKEQKGKGHVRSKSHDTCMVSQMITGDKVQFNSYVENNGRAKSALDEISPKSKDAVPVDAAEVKADQVTGLISKVDSFLKDSGPVQEDIQKRTKKKTKSKNIASRIEDSANMNTQRVLDVKPVLKNFNSNSKPDKKKTASSSQFVPQAECTQTFNMLGGAEAQVFQPHQSINSDLFAGTPVFMTPVGPRVTPPKPFSGSPTWIRSNRPQSPHFRPISPNFGHHRLPPTSSTLHIDDTGFIPVVHKYHNQPKQKSGKELFNKYQREGRLTLVLLRGLPGSGKSYLAKQIVGRGIIFSTDDYFIKDGVYQYDPNELSTAHTWNKQRAINAMEARINPVIIDNTNTKVWEMKPYAKSAIQNGYDIVILEPDTPWKFKTRELQARNTHGVSKENINKMKERYDNNVTVEQLLYIDKPIQPTLKTIPNQNTSKNNNTKVEKSKGVKTEELSVSYNTNLNLKKEEATDSGINMEEAIQNYFDTKKKEEPGPESKPLSETQECKEFAKCNEDPWNEVVKEEQSTNTKSSWKDETGESVVTGSDKSGLSIQTDVGDDSKDKIPIPKPKRTKKRNRHNSTEVKKEQTSEMAMADTSVIQENLTLACNVPELKQSAKLSKETDRTNETFQENSTESQCLVKQFPLELQKAEEFVVHDSNDFGNISDEAYLGIMNPKSDSNLISFEIDGKDEKIEKSQEVFESCTENPKPQRNRHSSSKSSNCSEASNSSPDRPLKKSEESDAEEFFDANTSLNHSQNFHNYAEDDISKTGTEKTVTIQNRLCDAQLENSAKSENSSDSNQNSPCRPNRRKKRMGKPLLDKELKMKIKTESWNSFTVEDFKQATLPIIPIQKRENETNVSDSSTLTEGLDFKFLDNINLGIIDPNFTDYVKIMKAKCTKIHEDTPETNVSILRVFGLDKGCMTDDLMLSLEPNLDFLRTSFPELSDERCKEILEMCQNDVEWAINLILDCDPTVSLTSGEKEEIASEVLKLKRGNSVTSPDVIIPNDGNNFFIDLFSPKSLFDICNDKIKSSHIDIPEIQKTLIQSGMKQLEQMETHAFTRMKSIPHENVVENNWVDTDEGVYKEKLGWSVKSIHGYASSISYILNEDIMRREGVVEETEALKMLGNYDSSDSSDENETLNSVFQSSLKKNGASAIAPAKNPGTSLLHLLTSCKTAPTKNIPLTPSSSITRIDSAMISVGSASSFVTPETLVTDENKVIFGSKTWDKCNENELEELKTVKVKDSTLEKASHDNIVLCSESTEILAELKEVTPLKSAFVSRDITSPIDDVETELSLKLPSRLVSQLEQLFGQITETENHDDQEIYLDLRAAKHLHRCLKVTTKNETIEKHAQLRNDEALARRIQEEENKSRRVKAKIQPKPVFLEDIIQDELARKNTRDKYTKYIEATGDHIAIATKLKRQKLLQKYPGLDETFFEEIFQANGYSYEDTVSALKSALGPTIPVKTVMTPQAEEEYYSKLIDEAKQNSLLDMVDSPLSKKAKSKESQGIESHDLDYHELRSEADLHRRLRQQCFVKARESFQRGMREVSSFYSQQGHLHSQKLKDANVRASQKILESRQLQVQREMTLDLHGFHVEEAIVVLNRIMEEKEKEFSARPDRRRQYLYVITGRGLNSRGGVAKIRPAILSHLKSNNVRFSEEKPGLLKVQLKYKP